MTTTWTRSLKRWISMGVLKQPVRWMPRGDCEHHAVGCFLCPRTHCIGALNDMDDPDLTKPRTSASGQSVHVDGADGPIRLYMGKASANAHYARKAAARGEAPIEAHEMTSEEIAELEQFWFTTLFYKLGD